MITPVVDHLCARSDVNEDRLALLGVSQAGYFTEAEGADGHIEPAGAAIRGERIFDWLDYHLPAAHHTSVPAADLQLDPA